MKSTFKQLFGTLLLVGGVAFTAACGDDAQQDCTTNADCTSGVCDTGAQVCLGKSCANSTECADQGILTECKTAPASVVNQFMMICQEPTTMGGCADQVGEPAQTAFCEAEEAGSYCIGMNGTTCAKPTGCGEVPATLQGAYCTAELSEPAACNAGKCEPSAVKKEAKYIRITDVTSGCVPTMTNGASDSGSDISIVNLLRGGQVAGSAKIPGPSAYKPGSGEPGYQDVNTVFDGKVKSVGDRGCPTEDAAKKYFRQDTAVSLGCAGSIVLGFEFNGPAVNLANNDEIRVVELGRYCDVTNDTDDYGTDRYRVDICLTDEGKAFADIDLNTACGTAISGPSESGPSTISVGDVIK